MKGTAVVVPISTRLDRVRSGSLETLDDEQVLDQARGSDAFVKLVRDMGATEEEGLDALELAIRIQREAGKRLAKIVEGKGTRNRYSRSAGKVLLTDLGVSKKQSSRWQKIGRLKPEPFEAFVEAKRGKIDKVAMQGTVKEPGMGATDGDVADPDEYYTPTDFIEMVHEVMGGIDLDPASNEIANTAVRATRYFTKEEDGLTRPWKGRIFVNWPTSKATAFAEKLLGEIAIGNVIEAIALDPAVDTSVTRFHSLAAKMGVCFAKGRINFDRDEGKTKGNRYAQAFFYHGPNRREFQKAFRRIGLVGWLR